ncbi:MAG: cell envelope integrity protein TolA [Pseudomonadales bacterium]|nr:cell envelope integrity protein TolA [Pseudomonadales bacterium]
MDRSTSYILPSFLAAAFHALVIVALLLNWQRTPEVDVTPVEKYYIDAAIVSENPYKAKARKVAAAREKSRQQRIAAEKQAAAQRAREAQARKEKAREQEAAREAAEAAAKKKQVEQTAPDTAPAQDEASSPDSIDETERVRMEQSLALAVMDEQEYRRAVTDDEKAMAYVAQIRKEIVQNWSRPPSARNGMQALLKVHLVPTGEVVDVAVIESSGNDAFDRSATQAVEKARRFTVPTDSRQFERNFREFEVLFRPEDLRL